MKKLIPEVFYRGDAVRPRAETVGELMDQLSRLPRDLPMTCTKAVVVYNINQEPVVEIEECDD